MDTVFLGGMMDKFLKDNGKWELKTDMEFGQELMGAIMKEIGN